MSVMDYHSPPHDEAKRPCHAPAHSRPGFAAVGFGPAHFSRTFANGRNLADCLSPEHDFSRIMHETVGPSMDFILFRIRVGEYSQSRRSRNYYYSDMREAFERGNAPRVKALAEHALEEGRSATDPE